MKKYLFPLLFNFLIFISTIYLLKQNHIFHPQSTPIKYFISTFSNTLLFLTILIIISKIKSKIFSNIFTIIFIFFISIDIIFLWLYNTRFAIGNLMAIIETNQSEAWGFFLTIGYKALIYFTIISFITFYTKNALYNTMINWKYIGLCLFILLGMKFFFRYIPFPIGFQTSILSVNYLKERQNIKKYSTDIRKTPKWLTKVERNSPSEKIFLVIGESSHSKHYNLYGYDIPTTPNLNNISQQDSLLYFHNVISPSNLTIYCLQLSLSYALPNNLLPFEKEKNILEVAKDQGYEIVWISNNGKLEEGIGDNHRFINSVIYQIAYTSDKYEFIAKDDLDLIPLIQKNYKENKKQFFIVHLQGSHAVYDFKYDKNDTEALKNFVNSEFSVYDRTIHHTDRVLNEIYTLADKHKSIIFYFSDHGEIVNIGHALTSGNKDQYEIPFIIFPFQNNKDSLSYLVNKYRDSNSGILNNSSFSYIFSEYLGYKIKNDIILNVINSSPYIYNTDQKVYKFQDIKNNIFTPIN